MRAILLASATATTLKGRRARSCVSQGYFPGRWRAYRNTAQAPTMTWLRLAASSSAWPPALPKCVKDSVRYLTSGSSGSVGVVKLDFLVCRPRSSLIRRPLKPPPMARVRLRANKERYESYSAD